MIENVLVLIKPDGMNKRIIGEVITQLLASNLNLIALKMVVVSKKKAEAHYHHLKGKFFFKQIVGYLMGEFHQGSPVVAMVFEGKKAIATCRKMAGVTNPEEALPVSIRGKYGRITTKGLYENLVHVSSDDSEARREIALWFKRNELVKGKI